VPRFPTRLWARSWGTVRRPKRRRTSPFDHRHAGVSSRKIRLSLQSAPKAKRPKARSIRLGDFSETAPRRCRYAKPETPGLTVAEVLGNYMSGPLKKLHSEALVSSALRRQVHRPLATCPSLSSARATWPAWSTRWRRRRARWRQTGRAPTWPVRCAGMPSATINSTSTKPLPR
jgi:hypothetical protein